MPSREEGADLFPCIILPVTAWLLGRGTRGVLLLLG